MPGTPVNLPHLRPDANRLALDTETKAEDVQLQIFRRMTSAQKVRIVEQAHHTARHLAMVGLRERYPCADETELRFRYMALIHGEELARRVYGDVVEALSIGDERPK